MNTIIKTAITIAISLFLVMGAFATEYTKGTVKKINMKSQKVTIIHEELLNLEMPAMTMVFRVASSDMLEKMKAGDAIEFVADRVKGKLTITNLK